MSKAKKFITIVIPFVLAGFLNSCADFFNPDQGINITEEQLFTDWYEYRAASMGLYALQQNLVEQLVVLGELRGDLLTVTDNADGDLMEIYNFNVTRNNKYASPENFFKLIAATNRFISVLENEQPTVLDPAAPVNNYDRLYGEALSMRAWAYFNAVRIYGKVPFIDQRFTSIEEINEFLDSPSTYVDSIVVKYSLDGYHNDTIYGQEVILEKNYFDTDRVIRHFANELETKVKAVGVNHYIHNDDNSWEVTVWSTWSMNTLLGHMYLTLGDLAKSTYYFEEVVKHGLEDDNRYQLDNSFQYGLWPNIFTEINTSEHILTLEFNKQNQQQHDLQKLFEPFGSNEYMLKPTRECVHMWETEWVGMSYIVGTPRDSTRTVNPGSPGDFMRGFAASYIYINPNTGMFPNPMLMLEFKRTNDIRSLESLMDGMDTIVYKYSLGKDIFDHDANFIIYRAGGVNLYLAEIYNYWRFVDQTGTPRTYTQNALNIINDGSYYNATVNRSQLGVRGRVGLPGFTIEDYVYVFDPFTNEFVEWYSLAGDLLGKQQKLENEIMDERARELAFEGERFYDLMRVAKRRGDPTYLAEKVSKTYPEGMRSHIYNLLLNEQNWYINYFD
jgi:hypothetical protein